MINKPDWLRQQTLLPFSFVQQFQIESPELNAIDCAGLGEKKKLSSGRIDASRDSLPGDRLLERERRVLMFVHRHGMLAAVAVFAAIAGLQVLPIHAQTDFVTAVTATHPIAYYRLDNITGKSQVGTTAWKSTDGVTWAVPGAPIGIPNNHFAKFDGRSGKITTTQMGGVSTTVSIMAWVNLASLPSKESRTFYVAGESESGNDLDVQFETDNALRFFTASGGHISFTPSPAALLNQWHMIVVTLDTPSHTREIFWDGKSVASDKGGGEAGKKNVFTIGESPVFTGRFFHGGIEEVALWNRALKAADVAALYAASKSAASASGAPMEDAGVSPAVASSSTPTTGPFSTTAKVEINDAKGPIQLKREEQIAYMFLSAFEIIEHNCQLTLQHVCPFEQTLSGAYPKGTNIERLKYDPNKVDPNYTYTLLTNGMAWEAHANPKRPGLKGFCFMARDIGTVVATYNNNGAAGWTSTPIGDRGMEGDSFATQ